ncbi:hypothetical protein C0995_006647, partial [Termitomyces sp. Mi166
MSGNFRSLIIFGDLPPVLINHKEEYEVEEILDSHLFWHKLQFKVKWKGYGIKNIFWEPQEN